MAKIIDGAVLADTLKKKIVEEMAKTNIKPGLGVVRVGDNPASKIYVNRKEKACQEVGFYSEKRELPESTTQDQLLSLIEEYNNNPQIHGILVQLPLPEHINEEAVITAINPRKDIDGFHFYNIGRLFTTRGLPQENLFIPCTPKGIIKLIESTGVTIEGKKSVVIGRSNIVGKPVALLLLQKNATVEICHSKTQNLPEECRSADIVIAALGKKRFVTADMVKPGAIVIDVGINRVEDGTEKGYHLEGDVDFDNVSKIAGFITPVPGGVGPMTIACLLENTLIAAQSHTPHTAKLIDIR